MWEHKFIISKNISKMLFKLSAKSATTFGHVPDCLSLKWIKDYGHIV